MKRMTAAAGFWRRFALWIKGEPRGVPKSISDHHARDIGMSQSELARHRFVWPSQSQDRPLL